MFGCQKKKGKMETKKKEIGKRSCVRKKEILKKKDFFYKLDKNSTCVLLLQNFNFLNE